MAFKSIVQFMYVSLYLFSLNIASIGIANAASVPIAQDWLNNGDELISYDVDTGLEWLDLSVTSGRSYAESRDYVNSIDAMGGWQYATNKQINDLFAAMFPNFVPFNEFGYANSYPGIESDVLKFQSLFGPVASLSQFNDVAHYTNGFYKDESGIIRYAGTYLEVLASWPDRYYVNGVDHTNSSTETYSHQVYGVYLVRSNVVPIPASIWLFGSGLIGLIGIARRRKNA